MNVALFAQAALEFLLSLITQIFCELSSSEINLQPSWDSVYSLLYKLSTIFKNTVEPSLDKGTHDSQDLFPSFLKNAVLNFFPQ